MPMNRDVPPLKTYSHLAGQRRVPTDYEIVSTKLLYHPQKGFEVELPARAWYDKYQRDGRLGCGDWEKFHDPRATTYPSYTALQSRQEAHLDGVLHSWQAAEHDPAQVAAWGDAFLRVLAPLRFALHGFQMIAAYVGQMAPSGRITMAALFQAADELRRVHRIAYQMGWLRRTLPGHQDDSRRSWQHDPAWQPLRRAVELALVTYDWGEALVALNLAIKPLVEALFLTEAAREGRKQGDFPVGELLSSFDEDGRWHQAWTTALVGLAFSDRPENIGVVQEWLGKWRPLAGEATRAAAGLLGQDGAASLERAELRSQAFLRALGLAP
jgi:toluene monooxygenase system protein E